MLPVQPNQNLSRGSGHIPLHISNFRPCLPGSRRNPSASSIAVFQ